jgi:hypothetical protein
LTTTPYRVVVSLAGQLSRTDVGWTSLRVSFAGPGSGSGSGLGSGAGLAVGLGGAEGDGLVGAGVVGEGDGFAGDGDGDGDGDGLAPPPVVPGMRNRLFATFQCDARKLPAFTSVL